MKKIFFKTLFYFVPFFLLSIFLILLGTLIFLKNETKKETILASVISLSSPPLYPVLTIPGNNDISAKAAIVADRNSGVVVYTKNPDVRFSPASTTKIMTAIVGLSVYQLDDILTVKGPLDTEGSGLGLTLGEKMTFRNLLYSMFLLSANDAAQTVAQNYPGGEDAFVSQMNETAKRYHLYNTHFGDPAGLNDDLNYTTVEDLAKLTEILLQNPFLREVVRQKSAVVTSADGLNSYEIKNRNKLLGLYGIDGVKTGYTDGAKEVLVTSVENNSHSYVVIVMDSNDRFADTLTLVRNILPNISYEDISM